MNRWALQRLAQVRTPVTVVAGPPCAGKSRYVAERKGPRDLVWDYDTVEQALTLGDDHARADWALPFVCEARDALLVRLARTHMVERMWVITFGARRADRALPVPRLDVVILDIDPETCKQRAIDDHRPPSTLAQIDKWWNDYERQW